MGLIAVGFALLSFLSSSVGRADQAALSMLLPQGNRQVAERYGSFESANFGCQAVNNGPRVILTGFGLFAGFAYNISGVVIENLASEEFWPTDAEHAAVPASRAGFKNGVLSAADHGARVFNRSFRMGEQEVSACLILTDVLWDFAGAVIVREIERFQPQVVIMSGAGDGSLEAGAVNDALSAPGFTSDGKENSFNTPQARRILPDEPLDSSIAMTWDAEKLGSMVSPLVSELGFSLSIPRQARPSNDYICNNVSYLVLQAAQGHQLTLAGGKLILRPKINSNPKIGFFHYPAQASVAQAPAWAQVVLTLVEGSLPKRSTVGSTGN
jgi:pyrrolidone-carboxylate peptidase